VKKTATKTMLEICTLALALTLVFSLPAMTQESQHILVVPFAIHAADELTFLRSAVTDMLYSRLSQAGRRVSLAQAEPGAAAITLEEAILRGQRENAHFVVMGSVTILDTLISTDARLIDIPTRADLLTFTQVGQSQGDIIAHMEQLTAQINQALSEKAATGTSQPPAAPVPVPPDDTPPDPKSLSVSYWKSQTFPVDINGIAVADIDGDNSAETLFIDQRQVHVYRFHGQGLEAFQTIRHDSFHHLIRLEAADINQNGRAEIVLTDYIASQGRVKSMILEWNGEAFELVAEKPRWYLRVLHTSPTDTLLIGQRRGPGTSLTSTSLQEALFDEDIYIMSADNGSYDVAAPYALPRGLTLYDFTRGDAANDGIDRIVSFTRREQLAVHDPAGDIVWRSTAKYGGNRLYFEVPDLDDPRESTNYYLPQRIHIVDIDRDGSNEIILVKNHDSAGVFKRLKVFKKAYIVCLSLDDIGLNTKWQTRQISGYISDTAIGDLDNDGMDEIVFAGVEKAKSIVNKGKSYIMACEPVFKP